MATLVSIYHYPFKGLSPQPLQRVAIQPGAPLPHDRTYALARPDAPLDPAAPRWGKKGCFVMLMLDEALARWRTHLDPSTAHFTIHAGGDATGPAAHPLLSAALGTASGRQAVEDFFALQLPQLRGRPRLMHLPSGHFMDKPDPLISCVNLATVRSLEAQWGCAIDPLRFRANVYLDGLRPWEELAWPGHLLRIGGLRFAVDRRNGRCGATNVNPVTGLRDLDIPGRLRQQFGHKDLGVYLRALDEGTLGAGATVVPPHLAGAAHAEAPPPALPGPGTHQCRGCYYRYDPAAGAPGIAPGTPVAALPPDWRCPDCGHGREGLVPLVS